jgi:hypothetical protein
MVYSLGRLSGPHFNLLEAPFSLPGHQEQEKARRPLMPMTIPVRRLALAAMVSGIAALGLAPGPVRAEALVACFGSDSLGDQQAAPQLLPLRGPGQIMALDANGVAGFAPADPGPPRDKAAHVKAAPARERNSTTAESMVVWRKALHHPMTLAALILMVGDIPTMPPLEVNTTINFLSGPADHGFSHAPPGTGSSSVPTTAPEPTGLLSGLLGFGLTGIYALSRRKKVAAGLLRNDAGAHPKMTSPLAA